MIPGTKRFLGGLGYGEVPPDKRLDGRVSISHSNLGGPWVAGLSCRSSLVSSLVSSPHDPIIQEPGVHWVHFSYLFRWGTEGSHGGLIISRLGDPSRLPKPCSVLSKITCARAWESLICMLEWKDLHQPHSHETFQKV